MCVHIGLSMWNDLVGCAKPSSVAQEGQSCDDPRG